MAGTAIGAALGAAVGAAAGGEAVTGAAVGAIAGGTAGALIPGPVVKGRQYYRDTRGYCYYVDDDGRTVYDYDVQC